MKKNVQVIEVKPFMLLPPRPEVCQVCAHDHEPEQPHNAQTMYYLTKFKMENDRDATWEDALAHCTDEIKALWRRELGRMGVDTKSTNVRRSRD